MNNGGKDMRIYYGEARIIVPCGDDRIGQILALAHEGPLKPPPRALSPRMLCWLHRDASSRGCNSPLWLPEGETPPDVHRYWRRAPWMDEP